MGPPRSFNQGSTGVSQGGGRAGRQPERVPRGRGNGRDGSTKSGRVMADTCS